MALLKTVKMLTALYKLSKISMKRSFIQGSPLWRRLNRKWKNSGSKM